MADGLGSECRQENGRRQKQALCDKFDALYTILEERKKELVESVSREQDRKLRHVRGLIRCHGDHLEAAVKLVEAAIQSMEEPQMAVFLQVSVRMLLTCLTRWCHLGVRNRDINKQINS